jgi:hypothetical protein
MTVLPARFGFVLVLAACTTGESAKPDVSNHEIASGAPVAETRAAPIRASREVDALRGAGLDPARLPELDADASNLHALPLGARKAVMHGFADSLGVSCDGCHASASTTSAANEWPKSLVAVTRRCPRAMRSVPSTALAAPSTATSAGATCP